MTTRRSSKAHKYPMLFTELFEAAPSRVIASKLYWHGTNNTAGQKVLSDGFVVGSMRPRGTNYLPPLLPGIYMTPNVTYALNFAKWDNGQKFGWLFAASGADMIDIEIDEDDVGEALKTAYKKEAYPNITSTKYVEMFNRAQALALTDSNLRHELIALARQHLSSEDIMALQQRNHGGETARAGAVLIPHMRPETKLRMIDQGCHIAHMANFVPAMAWRFNTKDIQQINNDLVVPGNSPIDVLDRLAQRMR